MTRIRLDKKKLKEVLNVPEPESESSYIVYARNGVIYAKNGRTGQIEFSGTDASAVIQSAINSLTPDRTWKEKIVFKGDFTISATITPASYTIYDFTCAKFKAKDGLNADMFYTSSLEHCEFIGGIIDGNNVNQTSGRVFHFGALSRTTFKNIRIVNSKEECIRSNFPTDVIIENCIFENQNNSSNIALFTYPKDVTKGYNIRIVNNYFKNVSIYLAGLNNIFIVKNTMELDSTVTGLDIIGINITECAYHVISKNRIKGGKQGIASWCSPVAEGLGVIVGNICTDAWTFNDTWGIGCGSTSKGIIAKNVCYNNSRVGINPEIYVDVVEGNVCYNNGVAGIVAWELTHAVIANNKCYNNTDGGINVGANTAKDLELLIINNICHSNGKGIQLFSTAQKCIVVDNKLFNNTVQISDSGLNNVKKRNIGYVTENSGTATIPAGATYVDVSHGLAITPDINRIKVTPEDNLAGKSFWVSNVTSTTFRINISSADTVDHSFGWSYE